MTILRQKADLPRTLSEVPAARAQVGQTLSEFGCGEAQDISSLLTTELVTNAIRHGSGPITLLIECVPHERIRVAVRDEGDGKPRLQHPDPADPSGGRGLLLVDAFSEAWGVDEDARGKSVWFELDVVAAS